MTSMSEMQDFSIWLLHALATWFGTPPISYLYGLLLMIFIFIGFKYLAKR